jgi:hypothetical protein
MSTLTHAVERLSTFGIDVDPDCYDVQALRLDASDIRSGVKPLHLDVLPPCFAADLLETVADILNALTLARKGY